MTNVRSFFLLVRRKQRARRERKECEKGEKQVQWNLNQAINIEFSEKVMQRIKRDRIENVEVECRGRIGE